MSFQGGRAAADGPVLKLFVPRQGADRFRKWGLVCPAEVAFRLMDSWRFVSYLFPPYLIDGCAGSWGLATTYGVTAFFGELARSSSSSIRVVLKASTLSGGPEKVTRPERAISAS